MDDIRLNIGMNRTISDQCRILEEILKKNKALYSVISTIHKLNIKNLYVAGGCISQTVWNYELGYKIDYGIEDIDIIYFDDEDLSYEAEDKVTKIIKEAYKNINYKIDVKNEARVHIWYKDKFGVDIEPYTSTESAINSWTASMAVGVNYNGGKFNVYAPYGLNDLFSRTVRPNKTIPRKQQYEKKAMKWKSKWKDINIISW